MKVLVADDDPVSQRLMQGILLRAGYEVLLARDGISACRELAKTDGPRLALIDWMMPELDGPGVCREVRRNRIGSYVYIALITAKQSSADIVEGLEAGADDYLTKPCHPAELKARLLTAKRILGYEDKLIEAREAMRFRAMHDGLTQLWNRTSIICRLREAMDRAIEERKSVSVLLCDIDHFKQVNDRYGHLAGDAVLEEVATRLQGAVRKGDSVGRYGGEEFLVVLDGCESESLRFCAEQVRGAVSGTPFQTEQVSLSVPVSIGATTFEGWKGNISVEHLIKQADTALYAAKAGGRDCVCLFEPSIPGAESNSVLEYRLPVRQS